MIGWLTNWCMVECIVWMRRLAAAVAMGNWCTQREPMSFQSSCQRLMLVDPSNTSSWVSSLTTVKITASGLQDKRRRTAWERTLVQFQCRMFVASWTGVVRYHGPRPVNRPNNVWVCNHTSMIDYIILTSYSPFAVIMQLHAGWIAFLQTRVLSCLGCLWFNRNEVLILP